MGGGGSLFLSPWLPASHRESIGGTLCPAKMGSLFQDSQIYLGKKVFDILEVVYTILTNPSWSGGMVWWIEHLFSMHDALGSVPSTV